MALKWKWIERMTRHGTVFYGINSDLREPKFRAERRATQRATTRADHAREAHRLNHLKRNKRAKARKLAMVMA